MNHESDRRESPEDTARDPLPASRGAASSGRPHARSLERSGALEERVGTGNTPTPVRLGLRANWRQFALLLLVNAFVGGMIGLERTVVPLIAEQEFGVVSKTIALSFIVSFGLVKALANLVAGGLSDCIGRKWLLVAGWLAGLPVPFLLILAPTWDWIILANVLLGINQGLAWSSTVIMKIDLVGPRQRGLAMGLNESAGYLAVSLTALATGYVASTYALRPYPFYLGIVFALLGLTLSLFFVRETHEHAREEARRAGLGAVEPGTRPTFIRVLWLTSWKNRALFSASQAGMVNNLNDGMVWGLLPIFLGSMGLSIARIGLVAGIYPAVWGLGQLATGALSDRLGRKWMIVGGLWLQAIGIALVAAGEGIVTWSGAAALMGLGTALVYPSLLAAVSDVAAPEWRASAVGVYRLWRDSGYAAGALLSGLGADAVGLRGAIVAVAALTALSGCVVAAIMSETLPSRQTTKSVVPAIPSKSV